MLDLIDDVASSDDVRTFARAVVSRARETFSAAAASVSLVRDGGDGLSVESIAAEGKRSAFVRGTTQPLDALADIGQVLADRSPLYVADAHGMGARDDDANGVARWRARVDTGSHALLPLLVRERALGILTVDWADLVDFDEDLRGELERFASLAALGFASWAPADTQPGVSDRTPGLGEQPAQSRSVQDVAEDPSTIVVSAYEVTKTGIVVPMAGSEAMGSSGAAVRVWSVRSAEHSGEHASMFDVSTAAGPALTIGVGTVRSSADATADASAVGRDVMKVVRGAILQQIDPAETLTLLGGWFSANEAATSTALAILRMTLGEPALTYATAGPAIVAVLDAAERFILDAPANPVLGRGGETPVEDRFAFALPGDLVAVVIGTGAAEPSRDVQEALARALRLARTGGKDEGAHALFEVVRHDPAASAVLIEIAP